MPLKSSAPFAEVTGAVLVSKVSTDTTVYYNVTNGSSILRAVLVNNLHGSDSAYVQVFDSTASITKGTTEPDIQLFAPANSTKVYYFTPGITIASGLTFYTSKGPIGHAEDATNPSGNVLVSLIYSPTT